MGENRRRPRRTRRVFLSSNGPGPWLCCHCDEMIHELGQSSLRGVIHHVDEDVTNDDPANLEVMHHRCHLEHHQLGRSRPNVVSKKLRDSWASGRRTGHPQSDDTRRRISTTLQGHQVSRETRDKIAESLRGRQHTDERRAALRAAWVRRRLQTEETTR